MRVSQLESSLAEGRLALWGFGREGRAAHAVLRARWPQHPLSLICPGREHATAAQLADPNLRLLDDDDLSLLAEFAVVIKSPGISAYHPSVAAARAAGCQFTSGTALWFGEALPGLKICVTGTKGKSSTTALIAHLLRARGLAVGLAGNIGLPLLELLAPPLMPAVWAIELSSYQTGDVPATDVAVVLNLYPEHLDWHGSEAAYIDDKLALLRRARPGQVVLNHQDAQLRGLAAEFPEAIWFARDDGWHLRGGMLHRGDQVVLDASTMRLPGAHNRLNLCAALASIEAAGFQAGALAAAAGSFQPLPHRLQTVGRRDGVDYVNDSISTTPHASIAALECFAGRPTAILLGGYDRGVPWQVFADFIRQQPPRALILRGQNAPRIETALAAAAQAVGCALHRQADLRAGVELARQAVGEGGVVLLSPGAPSFPEFANYAERGRAFAAACGFASAPIDEIPGLGIH